MSAIDDFARALQTLLAARAQECACRGEPGSNTHLGNVVLVGAGSTAHSCESLE